MNRARAPALYLGVSVLASLGLTVVYALGGQPQLEGLLLGGALGGLALGLILWAKSMMPGGHFVQERAVLPGGEARARRDAQEAAGPAAEGIERRNFIGKLAAAALAALGVAALFPIRSLGQRPGRSLLVTSWRNGVRMVTESGAAVRPENVSIGGVLTVYPEGDVGSPDAQTLLIRLPPDIAPPGPPDAAVDGLVAFSKICTHAGCPVGLYQADTQELFCPCHQSVFSVADAARPTTGPATRPLPQLPIGLDDFGYLVARRDFDEPVGPGFWSRPQ